MRHNSTIFFWIFRKTFKLTFLSKYAKIGLIPSESKHYFCQKNRELSNRAKGSEFKKQQKLIFFVGTVTQLVILPPHISSIGQGGVVTLLYDLCYWPFLIINGPISWQTHDYNAYSFHWRFLFLNLNCILGSKFNKFSGDLNNHPSRLTKNVVSSNRGLRYFYI